MLNIEGVSTSFQQFYPKLTPYRYTQNSYLEGSTLSIALEKVEFLVSPSRAMTRGLLSASLAKAVPYACLVATLSPETEFTSSVVKLTHLYIYI